MSENEKPKRKRLPSHIREQLISELGTATDQALADKYSKLVGFTIERHTVFYLRNSRGIAAFAPRPYTPPAFKGRFEDAYPEVKELLGRVPLLHIARRYNVSRSCVRAAAERLGLPTRAQDFEKIFEDAGSNPLPDEARQAG